MTKDDQNKERNDCAFLVPKSDTSKHMRSGNQAGCRINLRPQRQVNASQPHRGVACQLIEGVQCLTVRGRILRIDCNSTGMASASRNTCLPEQSLTFLSSRTEAGSVPRSKISGEGNFIIITGLVLTRTTHLPMATETSSFPLKYPSRSQER